MLMLGEMSTLYSPVRANAVLDPYGLALTGFMLLVAWKAPPWIVVSWWGRWSLTLIRAPTVAEAVVTSLSVRMCRRAWRCFACRRSRLFDRAGRGSRPITSPRRIKSRRSVKLT